MAVNWNHSLVRSHHSLIRLVRTAELEEKKSEEEKDEKDWNLFVQCSRAIESY